MTVVIKTVRTNHTQKHCSIASERPARPCNTRVADGHRQRYDTHYLRRPTSAISPAGTCGDGDTGRTSAGTSDHRPSRSQCHRSSVHRRRNSQLQRILVCILLFLRICYCCRYTTRLTGKRQR